MVMGKRWLILGILFIILLSLGVGYYFFDRGAEEEVEIDFELDTLFLKVSLSENSSAVNHIKIEEGVEDFSIKVNQIPELVDFSYEKDFLDKGENEIEIVFHSNGAEPGIYLGELEISAKGVTKKIPIILEIQTEIVVFDATINLYPAGKSISPGKTFNANIKIFDLANFERSSIEVAYFIKNFEGGQVFSEKEKLIIEDKLDYSKSLTLPEITETGNYVLIVIVGFEDSVGDKSVGTSSVFFKVVEEESIESLTNQNLLLVIVIFGFFFLIFFGLFIYSLFFRSKMLKQVEKQYRGELRRQRKMIDSQRKEDYTRLKTPEEKREYRKELIEVKKLRLSALKKTKEKKIGEFKLIKKKFRGGSLKAQLERWKKEGYNTRVLEKKYKMPSVNNIKAKVREWKRKGYDMSILEKKEAKKKKK